MHMRHRVYRNNLKATRKTLKQDLTLFSVHESTVLLAEKTMATKRRKRKNISALRENIDLFLIRSADSFQ